MNFKERVHAQKQYYEKPSPDDATIQRMWKLLNKIEKDPVFDRNAS